MARPFFSKQGERGYSLEGDRTGLVNERRLAGIINDAPNSVHLCRHSNPQEDAHNGFDFWVWRRGESTKYKVQLKTHRLNEEGVSIDPRKIYTQLTQQGIIFVELITEQLQNAANSSGQLSDSNAINTVLSDFVDQFEAFARLIDAARQKRRPIQISEVEAVLYDLGFIQ